jgi:predicted ATPase/DNA-binding CsgD family transcriptional regulator
VTLRDSRLALGLSQEEFARRLGVSFATVNRWERGRSKPRGPALARLSSIRALLPLSTPSVEKATTLRNLGLPTSSFVGRAQELTSLADRLASSRLVTVIGPAGSGKTRLCQHAATSGLLDSFDAVTFVTLESVVDGTEVAAAAGRQLDIPTADGGESLAALMNRGNQLLLLDNCEHVLSACRQFVDDLLRNAPALRILATSREPLGLAGEAILRLGQLDSASPTSPAITLFVDRARREVPDFEPAAADLAAIGRLCRRLDGLPLAIELAAGCAGQVGPAEMIERLDERFALLVADSATAPHRQRELRAAIAWSYDLLTDRERAVLDALAVLPEPFALDAAESIAPTDNRDVLLTIASLAAKSLLEVRAVDDEIRYGMLESVRVFARERLLVDGEQAPAMTRLWSWANELAGRVERGMAGRDQRQWIDRAGRDAENIAAAAAWAIESRDARRAVGLAGAFWRYWYSRSDTDRGLRFLAGALELPGATDPAVVAPAARAKALLGAGVLSRQQGDYRAAVSYLRQHLALAEAAGDGGGIAEALNSLAGAYHGEGDSERAEQLLRRSLDYWETSGDRRGLASALSNLGVLASDRGDQAAASDYGEQALALRLALGHAESIAISYENLGTAALRAGQPDEARRLLAEALRRYAELGEPDGVATSLEGLAPLVEPRIGAQLLVVADLIRTDVGVPRASPAEAFQRTVIADLARQLGSDELCLVQLQARNLTMEQGVALAQSHLGDDSRIAPQHVLRRRLTRREREVLELVAAGHTSKEISSSLGLSVRTVDRHLANIYAKIGARGRAEAIAFALRTGAS